MTSTREAHRQAATTDKGEETRRRILEAALALLAERGYEGTTMRAVAEEAGVSVGNAYYYFRSKDHLVQAFYDRSHEEHLEACRPVLEREVAFEARLRGVMGAKIDTLQPHHRFAGALFKTAADPTNPLNPFSEDSRPLRQRSTELFAAVVRGARPPVSPDLAGELPRLLWLYQMGVVLFWIHDSSPGCVATYRLVDRSSAMVARLVELAANPLLRPLAGSMLGMVAEINGLLGRAPERS